MIDKQICEQCGRKSSLISDEQAFGKTFEMTYERENAALSLNWISVDDRLPKDSHEIVIGFVPKEESKIGSESLSVLCCYTYYYYDIDGKTDVESKNRYWYWHKDGGYDMPEMDRVPTHWIPLPEPPKENNNE